MIATPEQMREAAARLIETTAYTSNSDGRSLEPVSAGLVGMDMHHATIAAAIRSIPIATHPVAVMVKPLVWRSSYGCLIAKGVGIEYYAFTKGWNTSLDGKTYPEESREAAVAACQAHHDALIRDEITIQPADPLSDPRVVALVEALTLASNRLAWAAIQFDTGTQNFITVGEWADDARAALRAIGGEA